MLWRQGDLFIADAPSIPDGAAKQPHCVLAEGEITGHAHRIEDRSAAALYDHFGLMFLEVTADYAQLIHEEHGAITLPRGTYRAWRQREYAPPLGRESRIVMKSRVVRD